LKFAKIRKYDFDNIRRIARLIYRAALMAHAPSRHPSESWGLMRIAPSPEIPAFAGMTDLVPMTD
jgi:hypothetical protein